MRTNDWEATRSIVFIVKWWRDTPGVLTFLVSGGTRVKRNYSRISIFSAISGNFSDRIILIISTE